MLEVDGQPVSKFIGMGDSVIWRVVRSEGETIHIKADRKGDGQESLDFDPRPEKEQTKFWQRKGLRQIKIVPAESVVIAEVVTNSPAAEAV